MNSPHADRLQHAGWYRVRIKGHLASRWATRFDRMTLSTEDDGTTLIQGPVVDQAALHGLLQQVRDTGLPLVSVARTGLEQPDTPITEPRTATRRQS